MFNVLHRLRNLKRNQPQKYERVCGRLDELRRAARAGSELGGDCGGGVTVEEFLRLASVRKLTDDFFSRLATADRKNEEFWREIGSRWIGRTELEDLPRPRQRRQEELLIRTIVLSHHPKDIFKLILQNNHPQKILNKLLLSHERKNLLFGIRTKFGLPLATYLTPKQSFQVHPQRFPSTNFDEDESSAKKIEGVRHSIVEDIDFPTDSKSFQTDIKVTSGELINGSCYSSSSENVDFLGESTNPRSDVKVTFDEDGKKLVEDSDGSSHSHSNTHSSSSSSSKEETGFADDGAGGMDQYRLQRLKIIFEESDTDDEPGLDINEFKEAMKKILGENVPEREIELIFMKVDANCDGNVDWNEFLEFTLREFQERDAMTQLAKDAFFEKTPQIHRETKNQREIKALIFVRQHNFGEAAHDLTSGRYYSINSEGNVICWTTDFKKVASFDVIPDARGTNSCIRANDMCAMPEIKALVVSLTTGVVNFYHYDDTKLDLFFSITSLKSPVLCLFFHFREPESILLMGDQAGKVRIIRFKNLHYDGLWASLGLPHSNNPKITWSSLTKKGKAYSAKGMIGSDWINQVRFFPTINSMIACSLDPKCSMCIIPFHTQRKPIYFIQKDGFNCFDYSDFLNVIVTGSKNRSIQVWNQDNVENPTGHFDGHEAAVNKVVCFRDSEFTVLISVDAGHVLKVWDFKDQACLQSYDSKSSMLAYHVTTFLFYNVDLDHVIFGAREFILLKRVDFRRKNPVEIFQKTHDKSVVSVLFNDLFQCVVTACRASTIMVWNFHSGDKIIQYRNAHTVLQNGKTVQVPIKNMSFDGNKRRLITCGSDGLIKLWNFNNGACLSFFAQLDGVDLNVVRYQKNRDLVVAAGWNKSVFMVRDTRGEDDIDETVYEWEKAHRSDITALEIIYASEKNSLKMENSASPEDIRESGIEFASTASNTEIGTESKNGIETADKNEIRNSSGSEIGSINSSLDERDSKSGIGSDGDSEISGSEERAKLSDDGSFIISGSSDGELILWHLYSGTPVCFLNTDGCPLALSRKARTDHAAKIVNDFPKLELKDSGSIEHFLGLQNVQHQKSSNFRGLFSSLQDDLVTVPKVPQQARHCITSILVLQNRNFNNEKTASVVTASTDGFIRAWSIHLKNGGLLGLFFGAHELDSFTTTMFTDDKNELLFTGDTRGFIKIWLLCEWMQTPEELKGHRHCFDPRDFPFIKRHKIFASLVAFRANFLMKKSMNLLEMSQRGLYRQPYILNSFRGHLSRVTQIQVIFQKQMIITSSEDCSVRLWNFSGFYIGTFGQKISFQNDAIVEVPVAVSDTSVTPSRTTIQKTSRSKSNAESKGSDTEESVLREDEDLNEILLKPKVIVPVDLAEKGSLVTLQVLYGDRHERTEIPAYIEEIEDKKHAAEEEISGFFSKNRENFIEALQEISVLKNHFEDCKLLPFKQATFEVKDAQDSILMNTNGEDSIFTRAPLQKMDKIDTLEKVIPKNLFDFNLKKVQKTLLESLSAEQRKPFLELQLAGQLAGPALEMLRNLVKASEAGVAPPKPVKDSKFKPKKKFLDFEKNSKKFLQQRFVAATHKKRSVPVVAHRNLARIGNQSEYLERPSKKVSPPLNIDDKSNSSNRENFENRRREIRDPPPRFSLSRDSFVALNEDFLNANRIDASQLRESEEEFMEDLIAEQKRNAKFDYLALLEQGTARPSQIDPYLPLVEFQSKMRPMIEPGENFYRPKKVKLKTVKSINSMERIQRVFKMADFDEGVVKATPVNRKYVKGLRLVVPPMPRRLASVIKDQVRGGKKATSFFEADEADEAHGSLGGNQLWGDQESLPIFEQGSSITQHYQSVPSPIHTEEELQSFVKRSENQSTNLINFLHSKDRTFKQRRPFTNRYIYQQLSDSVLREPTVDENILKSTQLTSPS